MTDHLSFSADWVDSDPEGPPEERACLAELDIRHDRICLTEGHGVFAGHSPSLPILLRIPSCRVAGVELVAASLGTAVHGGGLGFRPPHGVHRRRYAWPDITIFSDGHRTALIAKPTAGGEPTAFRYIT
ncbi:MAG: hypothetical protein HC888_17730, partial [Candidatus Competibacteraceae bacterium]|nr:hypothetical protein [Candidatus Competibacteraceae bacterium]